jgi:hypothetical protein
MEFLVILGVAIVIAGAVVLAIYLHRLKSASLLPDPEMVKQALKLVWVDCYGMDLAQAPRIVFVTGKQLNCYNGLGWVDRNGRCVAGESWQHIRTCSVAYVPGKKLHVLAFAHELWHAVGWITGVHDPDHTGPGFQQDGPVEMANAVLEARGW